MKKISALMPTIALVALSAFSQSYQPIKGIKPVDGHAVDHHGIVINPTPQSLACADTDSLCVANGFKFKNKKDAAVYPWLKKSNRGANLAITIDKAEALNAGVKYVRGAYCLTVGKDGVTIIAAEPTGAFYAMQTLRELLESPAASRGYIPCLTVNDYPTIMRRGVVEGFYGEPWSHQTRLDLIDYYGRNKMNYYIYGPKDDPYHRSPHWRHPYPEKEAQNIRELVDACKRNHVEFVWAIHPGGDIRWTEEDYDSLVTKFKQMYDLGVRGFAIFFDDISGEGSRSDKQVDLLNRVNREFAQAKGDVKDLIVCPTDYSRAWANPSEYGQLAYYGRELDPVYGVFYTGDVVCSDLTAETIEFVNPRIQRPAFFWWNFPVNDYCRTRLLLGPSYGLDPSLSQEDVLGVVSNPMEHGQSSKLALYGLADYCWNTTAYNPVDSWNRAIADNVPEAAEAFRLFAANCCDPAGDNYRRDESWDIPFVDVDSCTQQQYDQLYAIMERIEATPQILRERMAANPILKEIDPWLDQFGLLGTRCRIAMELSQIATTADPVEFSQAYIANLMTPEEKKAYDAHTSGTLRLQPFYESTMAKALQKFRSR